MSSKKKWKAAASSRDAGGFVAMPWVVLDSPAYQALSHPAKALLMEFARQYIADNNGRLLASVAYLKGRGWKSCDVIDRAKKELMEAGFIHETVQGHRPNKASWYAITWATLDHIDGFDPGARESFQRGAYRSNTALLPAKTTSPKAQKMQKQQIKNVVLNPPPGIERASIVPGDGIEAPRIAPGDGTMRGVFGHSSIPGDGNLLEKPSTPGREEGRGPSPAQQQTAAAQHEQHTDLERGRYLRLTAKPQRLFTRLLDGIRQDDDEQVIQLAPLAVQRPLQATHKAVAP